MITVEKNGTLTDILEVFKEKYLNAGWKVTERPKEPVTDDAVNIIANSLDSKKAADSRQKDITDDAQMEAAAIVARELKKREKKTFTDGLIKE